MATSDVCGNDYDEAFQVTIAGKTNTYDSLECAIHALAPTCAHVGARSSDMAWRREARCPAAHIARRRVVPRA
jgi:hypothetical protein